ncbi:MAG: hypothetical protein HOV81_10645 [Kofleriaceae bacterium]|nr:hypothetical protein [Kofleriaceae bacterium]
MKLRLDRLVVPAATLATSIAITAVVATCGHPARGGYPNDLRSRALTEVSSCDAGLANMGRAYAKAAPEFDRLLATDHAAARVYLEQRIAPALAGPLGSCNAARAMLHDLYQAGPVDMRVRIDAGRVSMHAVRLQKAEEAYVTLHTTMERKQTDDLRPLVAALADAMR